MVKGKKTHIRPHPNYFAFASNVRKELEPKLQKKITDRELTGNLISFIEEENLTHIFMRKKKKRGGW